MTQESLTEEKIANSSTDIIENENEVESKNENIELASKLFYEKVGDLVYERYVKEDSRFSTIIEKFTKDHPQTCEGIAK